MATFHGMPTLKEFVSRTSPLSPNAGHAPLISQWCCRNCRGIRRLFLGLLGCLFCRAAAAQRSLLSVVNLTCTSSARARSFFSLPLMLKVCCTFWSLPCDSKDRRQECHECHKAVSLMLAVSGLKWSWLSMYQASWQHYRRPHFRSCHRHCSCCI